MKIGIFLVASYLAVLPGLASDTGDQKFPPEINALIAHREIDDLIKLLSSRSVMTKIDAANALGVLKDKKAVSPLLGLLKTNQFEKVGGTETVINQKELDKCLIKNISVLTGVSPPSDISNYEARQAYIHKVDDWLVKR